MPRTSKRLIASGIAGVVTALAPACAVLAPTVAAGHARESSDRTTTRPVLHWHACGAHGARCASLRVPRDWAHPHGAQLSLGLTELRAKDPARDLGTLFFNPGGPGGGTRQIVRDDAAQYFPAPILRRFDVVGVDLRGVRPSTPPTTCGLPTRSATITTTPTTRAGYRRLLAYERRVDHGCLTSTGPLLRHMDTISNARDLNAARVALGVQKISWLGLSYGSLLGATYAHLFPRHVRAAVLDGALDHTVGPARLALDEARSTEGEFGQFNRWCQTDRHCALHGRNVAAIYRGLLARARRHPIPADGYRRGVDADRIGYSTSGWMEISARWPRLARDIKAASGPHPNAADLALAGVPENAAYRATTCEDFPTDIRTYRQFNGLLVRLWRAAPVTGPYVEGWGVDSGCMGWPIPAANPWGPVRVTGTPPLLVVGGAHDPSTPRRWARGLSRQIHGSRLLLWNGSGHTGYVNDPSVRARETAYLLSPRAPVPGTTTHR
jgi:pimeloyl-ACP methyl ester carboxylesterase